MRVEGYLVDNFRVENPRVRGSIPRLGTIFPLNINKLPSSSKLPQIVKINLEPRLSHFFPAG